MKGLRRFSKDAEGSGEGGRRSPFLLFLSIATVLLLFGMLVALEYFAEHSVPLSLLIFAPPQILAAPSGAVGLLCLLFRRGRLALVHAACVLFVFAVYMTLRITPEPAPLPGELKIVTHNAGQGNRVQFDAFIKETDPDVILLQDYKSPDLAKRFPGRKIKSIGEFHCISKFPVVSGAVVKEMIWDRRPLMARFEIIWETRNVALYSVHLPTPRPELGPILRLRTRNGLQAYARWLERRRTLAQAVSDVFTGEQQNFIAAGDFNTPDHGYIYHRIASVARDSFAAAGNGWGFTFPGDTRNPITLFQAWLRIDYVFAGKGWKPVYCKPEQGRKSQHRAVFARLRPA